MSRVTDFPGTRQAVPNETTETVARAIFTSRGYPLAVWTDPIFRSERDDCLLLAAQFREMFQREGWGVQTAEDTLTAGTIHLLTGGRPVSDQTRHELRQYAQSFLEDLMPVFGAQVQRELDRKVS